MLGVLATLATTVGAGFLASCYRWDEVRGMLTAALRWVLGLSLLFELFVSVVIREKLLPFWVDYSHLEKIPNAFYWSRNLLFEGGRIQGIVGNSNILGMLSVLALVLFALARVIAPLPPARLAAFAVGSSILATALFRRLLAVPLPAGPWGF